MRSELLGAACLLAACGDPLHLAEDEGAPIARLRAAIEGAAPESLRQGSLRAALLWADLAGDECAGDACSRGPRDFVPAAATHSTPLEAVFPSAFSVPLASLPPPRLLAGGVFGYAELVLFDDGDGDGALRLGEPAGPDTIVASGGQVLEPAPEYVYYVVYREGALPEAWQLFAAEGCVAPPLGFSVVRLAASTPGDCWVGDRTIRVRFGDSELIRELLCEPPEARSTYPAQPPPQGSLVTCESAGALSFIIDPASYCPDVRRFTLSGCDALVCDEPEWDLTAAPPSWWPCS